MRKMLAVFVALGMFAAATAHAASLTNTSYSRATTAAKKAAAYTLDKAAGFGRYGASDLKIARSLDTKGAKQKFIVASRDGLKSLTITVKKDAPGKYRAYIPNRYVFTPVGTGSNQ
jgi:hypothetical protein